jgi:hypothetical protein
MSKSVKLCYGFTNMRNELNARFKATNSSMLESVPFILILLIKAPQYQNTLATSFNQPYLVSLMDVLYGFCPFLQASGLNSH